MASYLFLTWHKWGHIEPVLPLARGLSRRGHRVVFCVTDSTFVEPIKERGFEAIAPFEHIWPRGYLHNRPTNRFPHGDYGPRDADEHFREWLGAKWITDGNLLELLIEQQFDAVFIDIQHQAIVLNLVHNRVRTVRLRITTAPADMVSIAPPLGLLAPEVVLWPEALTALNPSSGKLGARLFAEAARKLPTERYFVGSWIDFERPDVPFPWERLRPNTDLVYFSFGTEMWRHRDAPDLLRRCVEAAGAMPEVDVVFAAGRPANQLGELPSNVIAVERAPQLKLLERAAVYLTHCGASSIKESVHFGVPMVAIPVYFDQPLNAEMLEARGLGVKLDFRRCTPSDVARAIDDVRKDPRYRDAVHKIQAQIAANTSFERTMALLEKLAA